jgi:hypothetical protein
MNPRHDTVAGADELLDEGVVLCLEEAEAGRDAVVRWLARHPHLASELADFLAGQAQVEGWAAPLRPVSAPAELPPLDGEQAGEPVRVGGYEVISQQERDEGGMGVVYQARQEVTGKVVALKIIRPDRLHGLPPEERRTWVDRFRLEIRSLAEMNQHPNIVPIYHVGEHGRLYGVGLALVLLALPLNWYPEWAPLLFGLNWAAVLGWFGLAGRRFARAFQEESFRDRPLPETTAEG